MHSFNCRGSPPHHHTHKLTHTNTPPRVHNYPLSSVFSVTDCIHSLSTAQYSILALACYLVGNLCLIMCVSAFSCSILLLCPPKHTHTHTHHRSALGVFIRPQLLTCQGFKTFRLILFSGLRQRP